MRSGKDDARLPQVLEGLVLVSEGFSSIGLAVQGRRDRGQKEDGSDEHMLSAMKKETIEPIIGKSPLTIPFRATQNVQICCGS